MLEKKSITIKLQFDTFEKKMSVFCSSRCLRLVSFFSSKHTLLKVCISDVICPHLFPKRFEETRKGLTVQYRTFQLLPLYFLVYLCFSRVAYEYATVEVIMMLKLLLCVISHALVVVTARTSYSKERISCLLTCFIFFHVD